MFFIKKRSKMSDDLAQSSTTESFWGTFRWSRFALDRLVAAERILLSRVHAHITSKFVPIRLGEVYTITARSATSSDDQVPAVLIHGFGGGVGLWAANIDSASEKRVAHGFDLLGFGRSSRPTFDKDPVLAELQFVQSFEDWRREMKINEMIMVGHSFGAYLASSYALEYPDRVRHLVLVDPWGFPEKPKEPPQQQAHPVWIRALALTSFSPLAALRLAGPYGPSFLKKLRPDLSKRFGCDDPNAVYEYLYQCNARRPTGETAFNSLTYSHGWAKRPMIGRITSLSPKVPMTFIYGSKSWIDSSSGIYVQAERPHSYVDVQVVNGAGHHVYVDQRDVFNAALREVFCKVDSNEDSVPENNDEVAEQKLSCTATLKNM